MNIENLYRKFKSFVYYDNTALHLKNRLVEFETDPNFESKIDTLNDILKIINENLSTDEFEINIQNWMEEISFQVVPKKIKKETDESKSNTCIINTFTKKEYIIEKLNYIFDGPIELQLLCFYWILKYGVLLEKSYSKYNYANKLDDKYAQVDDTTTKTFVPYFKQYSIWRDNGILKAKNCHENNVGSSILMLDISSFYYSIHFEFNVLNSYFKTHLKSAYYEQYIVLTHIIERIFRCYNDNFYGVCNLIEENQFSLPLGLSISPLLANFFLNEFDKEVSSKLRPLYYGRYVDDIMIVLSEDSFSNINYSINLTSNFIKRNFISNKILGELKNGYYLIGDNYRNKYRNKIEIQTDKIKLYILDERGTPAIIENFIDNIMKNSSEFRYLPEESKVISDFYCESYSLLYNGTYNKFRSIEKFSGNKYGVSKYLAKIILTSKYWNDDKEKLNVLIEQVDSFFSGLHIIEYFSLWEKIFVFYVINNRSDKINQFYNRINDNLKNIKLYKFEKSNGERLRTFLKESCKFSLIQACTLNLNILKNLKIDIDIYNDCIALRKANLFKDNYLITPLVNYTYGVQENLLSLNLRCSKDNKNKGNCLKCDNCELELDKDKFKYSPRFIHYHEFQHYQFYVEAYKWFDGFFGEYSEKSIQYYCLANNFDRDSVKKTLPIFNKEGEEVTIQTINIPKSKKIDKLRVGVASIRVDSKNIEHSYLKSPNLSRTRFNSLVKLINYIEMTNSDLIVLPEVSVPFAWIGILTQFAQRQQKCLVFGIEHIINRNNIALNLLATVVPYNVNLLNYSYLKLRLKNHYSPDEIRLLKGYRYSIPLNINMTYDIFIWNGVRFACFNCFELADINHRAIFRNRVDFLTASEYNRDTNYFSNIVESVSRDVHCYFIQSNSSDFGDSRITKPSQTYDKDIVKIKGGINDQVVVGEIDIMKLRKFQYKEYELQKDDKSFKPTPPNFDKNEIEKILSE